MSFYDILSFNVLDILYKSEYTNENIKTILNLSIALGHTEYNKFKEIFHKITKGDIFFLYDKGFIPDNNLSISINESKKFMVQKLNDLNPHELRHCDYDNYGFSWYIVSKITKNMIYFEEMRKINHYYNDKNILIMKALPQNGFIVKQTKFMINHQKTSFPKIIPKNQWIKIDSPKKIQSTLSENVYWKYSKNGISESFNVKKIQYKL